MKITSILKQRPQGVSFEFFPPRTDAGKNALLNTVRAAKGFNPLYMSMTYGAGGANQDKTVAAVHMLLDEGGVEIMPHLTCIGTNQDAIKKLLDEYKSRGIENIMALRGDLPEGLTGTAGDFSYAKDLVGFIKKHYSDFCLGAAVYPEGHIETSTLGQDIEYTRQKIDAGVDFCVTQMFFDNKYFYSLRERMRAKGINVPVLPGIMPLTDINKIKQFIAICRTTIPRHVDEKMTSFAAKPEEMEKAGIDFTIAQCRDLIKNGARQLHFFTLNKPAVIKAVLDAI